MSSMTKYLDFDVLEAIDTKTYRNQKPYPWVNPEKLIKEDAFELLRKNMPDVSLFAQKFGYTRRAGQKPHDRYSLEYTLENAATIPEPWREFIAELCSDRYRNNIARLFNARKLEFRFHWHYAPNGCSVSPHCDAKREYGSHLFYFNSEEDWDPAWGGETLVLDDGGRLDCNSAPEFKDFDREIPCRSMGNVSALLKRSNRGWHAVREINCPEDRMRKIFIIVVNPSNLFWKVRDKLVGKSIQRF